MRWHGTAGKPLRRRAQRLDLLGCRAGCDTLCRPLRRRCAGNKRIAEAGKPRRQSRTYRHAPHYWRDRNAGRNRPKVLFNSLNHVNPANINTSLNSGTFGQVRGTTGQRVIQLNGRLSW